MSDEAMEMHFKGSPSVRAIADSTKVMGDLINHVAGREVSMAVTAQCVCDACGAKSAPVDLSNPEAAEATLREAGWVRDVAEVRDTCPECAGTS